jgi:hypothetical protein
MAVPLGFVLLLWLLDASDGIHEVTNGLIGELTGTHAMNIEEFITKHKACRPQKFRPRNNSILSMGLCDPFPHVASFSRLSVPQQYFLRLSGRASFRVPQPTNIVGTRCRESVSA